LVWIAFDVALIIEVGTWLFGNGRLLLKGFRMGVDRLPKFPVRQADGATSGVRFCWVALPREVS